MSARIWAAAVGFVVVAGVSPSLAGTPLPNPPFASGGFTPPTKDVLKQEEYVKKAVLKYAAKRTVCDQKAVIGLQLAYTPANPTKIGEVQAAWTACTQKVSDLFTLTRDKLLLKGTPACLDQAGIDAVRGLMDAERTAVNTIVYCDAEGANPDPVTGLAIPDQKQEVIGETATAKVARKAGLYAAKCYSKAASYAFKFLGVVPPEVTAKITACLAKASDVANVAIDKLDQTQKLPSCLSVAQAQGAVAVAISAADTTTDDLYCGSPSGAFVDGTSTF